MFRKIRRQDKAMSQEATMKVLEKGIYGTLSTIGEDGYAYGTPLNYVYKDGYIYIHCSVAGGHKIDNMQFCDKVCFTVVESVEVLENVFTVAYESVVVFGKASKVDDKIEVQKTFEEFLKKYSPQHQAAGMEYIAKAADKAMIWKIKNESISGKAKL